MEEKNNITMAIGKERIKNRLILDDIKKHPLVCVLLKQADQNLANLGYTEHGERHAKYVAKTAYNLMKELKFDDRTCELTAIAAYLHDVGNVLNRKSHSQSGAFFTFHILNELGMPYDEIAKVISAVANHDENEGDPVNEITAGVIIADKSDVHRSRVRNPREIAFDIHDRVNYAAEKSALTTDPIKRIITLDLQIDTNISKVMEYFEIFLTRMIWCQKAAKLLNAEFKLSINNTKFL